MKKYTLLLIMVLISLSSFAQNRVRPTMQEMEITFLKTLDELAKKSDLAFIDVAANRLCVTFYYEKNDNPKEKYVKRTNVIRLLLVGIDTILNHLDKAAMEKRRVPLYVFPDVIDDSDSIYVVYNNNIPSEHMKNPEHRKLYEEKIKKHHEDYQFVRDQYEIINYYESSVNHISSIVKVFFEEDEKDILLKIIDDNLTHKEVKMDIIRAIEDGYLRKKE